MVRSTFPSLNEILWEVFCVVSLLLFVERSFRFSLSVFIPGCLLCWKWFFDSSLPWVKSLCAVIQMKASKESFLNCLAVCCGVKGSSSVWFMRWDAFEQYRVLTLVLWFLKDVRKNNHSSQWQVLVTFNVRSTKRDHFFFFFFFCRHCNLRIRKVKGTTKMYSHGNFCLFEEYGTVSKLTFPSRCSLKKWTPPRFA